MNKIYLLILLSLFLNCGTNNHLSESNKIVETTGEIALNFANTITENDLKTYLYIIASDEFEGRETGEPGQKKAAEYLKNFYQKNNISAPLGDNNYFQEIPTEHLKPNLNPSENVLSFIEGTEKPEEILVISAHYDHLGMENGEIYNGADDDGSGTVAIMEIAQAFKKASENGNGPKRSILFLHVTGEEKGLLGSKYYTNYPIFPLAKTVANLNIDMIGRVDDAHENNPNFVYLIGSDKLSTELHEISEEMNEKFTNLKLDYTYNDDNDPNRFYYRSDHYNFAKNNIPIIFYFNGTHQDYHEPSDTPDKINYELLAKRTKLIFYTAWEIANRQERIKVDK
ncbi:M28 family metallopeptidase [Lutibacter sp.]|uniref:M28 family metallopeptidase n=1 Tax=Lutibacter sp. TaxID=1925666 RepID=UPI003569B55F